MELSIFQVDAFSSQTFSGNPAAVCPLPEWLPDATLQAIAQENNLAATAFYVPGDNALQLRWFTPVCEVELCGHATLAAAYVLFQHQNLTGNSIAFETKSGALIVNRNGNRLTLNLPARPPQPVSTSPGLIAALGGPEPETVLASRDYLVCYRSESDVRSLQPDMTGLLSIDRFAVIVTAPGDTCDFVSRFFAPAKGIPEDSVTGSAHSTLIPFWAERLGKTTMQARQLSRRGGELTCELSGDRVLVGGEATLYLRGTISL